MRVDNYRDGNTTEHEALRELKLWKRAGNQKQDSLSVER